MSLRLRRGARVLADPPAGGSAFGPTLGRQAIIDGVGPREVTDPGGGRTALVPGNSVAANQALINSGTVLWWPAGTYAIPSTGYSIPAGKTIYCAMPPKGTTRTSSNTAILDSASTSVPAVTIAGAGVTWHGGIIDGGSRCMYHSSGGIADNLTITDVEMRYGFESCMGVSGAFPAGTNNTLNVSVRYSQFHHGGRYNSHTLGADGWVWEYNEMHSGNDRHIPSTRSSSFPDDEGDCKWLNVTGFVYRYNYMHDSDGDLWLDTAVTNGLIEESVFENNHRMAVFNEDNSGVIIQRNHFQDNGTDGSFGLTPNYWQAGAYMGHITIARADATVVAYNDFVTSTAVTSGVPHHDIRLHYQNVGTTDTINTNVHHNRFRRTKASAASSGFITTYLTANEAVAYQTNNNVYDYNEYHVPSGTTGSSWWNLPPGAGGDQTWTEWQAGTSLPFAPASYYDPHGTITGDL